MLLLFGLVNRCCDACNVEEDEDGEVETAERSVPLFSPTVAIDVVVDVFVVVGVVVVVDVVAAAVAADAEAELVRFSMSLSRLNK